MATPIPAPTLQRLPLYYRALARAAESGTRTLTSSDVGTRVGVSPVQVRKDLGHLDERGKPGVGYETAVLAARLAGYLGLANNKDAVLVGAGNLGRALALYSGFEDYGLRIVALFDSDPAKVGSRVGATEVIATEALEDVARRLGVCIGIITTPASAAQGAAEALVAGGVRAIWNFAPVSLVVPDGVFVKDESLAASLAVLSYTLSCASTPAETSDV